MANIETVQTLSRQAGVSLYLCNAADGEMKTFHDGKVYDGRLPDWMHSFINGDSPMLPFENEGESKLYLRWNVGNGETIVFLDDDKFTALSKLLNQLLDTPPASMAAVEMALLQDKLSRCKSDLDTAQKKNKANRERVDLLEAEVASLKEQNADQAVRLKEAYSQNMELTGKLRTNEGRSPLQNKLLKDGFK